MGHKNICFKCRKSFSIGLDFNDIRASNCPDCGELMNLMPHRFRPPKRTDKGKWKTVEYLYNEGFSYQRIMDDDILINVNYPENLREAKVFVEKYKSRISIVK
ncbi:hypothetical protein SAMN04488028_11216 [Reichenbachiella agariperforans]|uniref:Uncharacterized protein n=1 Tax=Reichenbachiella agariperforans TaxID=156994 RepID=A0A1M6WG13_REIAG|nr:hypothetical protein SAMN04488028_11216 [Reichenbachiella agariperforans]